MADIKPKTGEEALNESWVELHFQQQAENQTRNGNNGNGNNGNGQSLQSALNGNYERLLIEAQRENSSKATSNASSRGSPKGSNSPVPASQDTQQFQTAEWIWDWSSRPEVQPPSEWKFKHPAAPPPRRTKLSVRNTKVMRQDGGVFCLENLPVLFLTHACSFVLGAATVFIYLKKCCNLTANTMATVSAD